MTTRFLNPLPRLLHSPSDDSNIGARFDGWNQAGVPAPSSQDPDPANPENPENISEDNVDDFTKLWDNPDQRPAQTQTQPQQQQPQQQQPDANKPSLKDQFQSFLKQHKFRADDSIDREELGEKVRNGDVSGIENMMENVVQQAMGTTMQLMHQVVQQVAEQAAEKAVKSSGVNMHSHLALEALHEALPFTKQKEIAPVAKSIFGQALRKTGDQEKAIKMTEGYFAHLSNIASGALNLRPNGEVEGGFPQIPDFSPENPDSGWDDVFLADTRR